MLNPVSIPKKVHFKETQNIDSLKCLCYTCNMDFHRIGMVMKFCRLKRGLTQDMVAQRVGVSTSYITSLENGMRTSIHSIRHVLSLMGIHPAIMEDPGLYETIPFELKKLQGVKAVCSTIDMHCYSLPLDMIQKILPADLVQEKIVRREEYIRSSEMARIISMVEMNRLIEIFELPVRALYPYSPKVPYLKTLDYKILENCVNTDPFFMILREIGIEIGDPYQIIKEFEEKLHQIRFLPLSRFEKQKETLKKVLEDIDHVISL